MKVSRKTIKNQKNAPINQSLIINCDYYVPYYINEKDWSVINQTEWIKILECNYNSVQNSNICSIDIGCKNFISLYGLDGFCYKIKSNFSIIDSILQDNTLLYVEKDKQIIKLINDLHVASAKIICERYDIIYVGLVNNKGNINSQLMNSIEDNLLKIISHKEFLDTLIKYSNIYNKKIKIVEESYTSVQCGVCSQKNKFTRIFIDDDSERRKYTCNYCNSEFCRDLNAARNILIKNEHV